MADWIRMRSSLLTNPRVTKMARLLLAERDFLEWLCPGCDVPVTRDETATKRHIPVVARVVVGALLPVWSMVNDTAARDGIVRHASSRDIDETAGVPGFGSALLAVDWLEELPDGEGVHFVNFEEHNSPQKERSVVAKTGAERSREYRERKAREKLEASQLRDAARDVTRDVTSDVTRNHREKRVEKKSNTPLTPQGGTNTPAKKSRKRSKAPLATDLPAWMQALVDLWHELLPELPGVDVMNQERIQAATDFREWVLTSRRRDGSARATNDEEFLVWAREFFGRARHSDFIMGRGKRSEEHKNWRCSFEFLLSARGMQKVIEQTEEPEDADERT